MSPAYARPHGRDDGRRHQAARGRDDRHRDHRRVGAHGATSRPVLAVVRGQRLGVRHLATPRSSAASASRFWQGALVDRRRDHRLVRRSAASSRSPASAGSAPTMILSRAAFGVIGQKVPGVISWLISIGWETFLAILAVLATATIFEQLGWGGGTATKVVAAVVVAAAHRRRLGRRLPRHHADAVGADLGHRHRHDRLHPADAGPRRLVAPCRRCPAGPRRRWSAPSSWCMTGFGLGWVNIAADWSRYQRRDASGARHRLLEHLRRRGRPGAAGGLRAAPRRLATRS